MRSRDLTLTARLLLPLILACLPGQVWAQSSVRGMVMGADGGPRPRRDRPAGGYAGHEQRAAATAADRPEPARGFGRQLPFRKIPAGSYALSADAPAAEPGTVANSGSFTLAANQNLVRNLVLRTPSSWSDTRSLQALAVTVAAAAVYLLFLWLYRFYNIIAPARALLVAQIGESGWLALELSRCAGREVGNLTAQLDETS